MPWIHQIPFTRQAILLRRLMAQKESVFAEIAAFFIFAVGNKSTWCVGSFR